MSHLLKGLLDNASKIRFENIVANTGKLENTLPHYSEENKKTFVILIERLCNAIEDSNRTLLKKFDEHREKFLTALRSNTGNSLKQRLQNQASYLKEMFDLINEYEMRIEEADGLRETFKGVADEYRHHGKVEFPEMKTLKALVINGKRDLNKRRKMADKLDGVYREQEGKYMRSVRNSTQNSRRNNCGKKNMTRKCNSNKNKCCSVMG